MKKKIVIGLVVLFLAAQAIQPSKNKGNSNGPKDITRTLTVPNEVLTILEKSCYDCHSNRTSYPWYDHITPVNWWVADHIKNGKRELNFTEFGSYSVKKQHKKLEEINETVEEGEMPLKSYLFMHGDARLNKDQKFVLTGWAKKAMDEINP